MPAAVGGERVGVGNRDVAAPTARHTPQSPHHTGQTGTAGCVGTVGAAWGAGAVRNTQGHGQETVAGELGTHTASPEHTLNTPQHHDKGATDAGRWSSRNNRVRGDCVVAGSTQERTRSRARGSCWGVGHAQTPPVRTHRPRKPRHRRHRARCAAKHHVAGAVEGPRRAGTHGRATSRRYQAELGCPVHLAVSFGC
jgi:hypothetical protein